MTEQQATKVLEQTLDQLRGILTSATELLVDRESWNNGQTIEDIYEECQATIWAYLDRVRLSRSD